MADTDSRPSVVVLCGGRSAERLVSLVSAQCVVASLDPHRLLADYNARLEASGALVSHGGLTYGGLVTMPETTLSQVLDCFHSLLAYLSRLGISKLRYKRIPEYYSSHPAGDVAYALFLLEARLCRQECSLVIPLAGR